MTETAIRRLGCGLVPGKHLLCLVAFLALSVTTSPTATSQPPAENRFLIVSDLHFNPMADSSLVSKLAAAEPSAWESILQGSKLIAFSQYGQDTNWWLLQSALNQMRTTLPHPAFIMVNGDLLAHRFPAMYQSATHDTDRENYRKFVLKTVDFLVLQLRKRFKDTPILLTPGNNDDECGNYSIEAGGRFLHDTSDLVRRLVAGDDEVRGSWEALGSYDIPHPTVRGVRIISINSVFFSAKYHAARLRENCALVDSTAAADLLTWLTSRLARAKEKHEQVWLMFHIPPGIDSFSTIEQYLSLSAANPSQTSPENLCTSAVVPMWVPEWTAQFDDLLQKYQATVIASLAAHTHTDDFRVIGGSATDREFVLISPAISPIYDQNPAFRVASYAPDGVLTDQSTYYLTNLEFASSRTRGKWKREYTFSQQWEARSLDAGSLRKIYDEVVKEGPARNEWLKLYNVSSSAAHLPANSAPALYCAIRALDPNSYTSCYCRGNSPLFTSK